MQNHEQMTAVLKSLTPYCTHFLFDIKKLFTMHYIHIYTMHYARNKQEQRLLSVFFLIFDCNLYLHKKCVQSNTEKHT